MRSFWDVLPTPCFVLAPMADVTDPAYRKLITEIKGPDVMWTEFVSADGLYYTREKKKLADHENPLMRDLQFIPGEHPIVAQLFSSTPESMAYASKLCAELGFDGIDINMGCPDKSIEKQGAGAAMIKSPETAKAIVTAARSAGIPVSVKTRIGYHKEEIDTWVRGLLELRLPALTVHLRTRKEMSKVSAHWELMPRIVALRNEISPTTRIIGNGDVHDIEDAQRKITETGCDGVMLGRAIFGNPWIFQNTTTAVVQTPKERLQALSRLTTYFSELRPQKSFHLLKKHIKAFVQGWDGAAHLRSSLMETNDYEAFNGILAAAITDLG